MPGETYSPNMNLVLPGVGVTAGPDYATDINNSLSIVDAHDHSAGSGVPITPAGLNISSDLSFGGNNITSLRASKYASQSAALTDTAAFYVVNGDAYYTDGSGNQIRLTQSGSIAGATGSISGLSSPASATYVSGSQTFVWQSAASTPANLDAASLLMRNLAANSKALTLTPPASMAANYSITLPSLPGAQQIMTLDASGNMSAPYTVDNSTLSITSNVIGVKANGITQTQLASASVGTSQLIDGSLTASKFDSSSVTGPAIQTGAVAASKLASINLVQSTSSGSYNTASTSVTPITNQSITFTPSGWRPVMLKAVPAAGLNSYFSVVVAGTIANATISWYRDGSMLASYTLGIQGATAGNLTNQVPPGVMDFVDLSPSAVAHTYTMRVQTNGCVFNAVNVTILAYEMA